MLPDRNQLYQEDWRFMYESCIRALRPLEAKHKRAVEIIENQHQQMASMQAQLQQQTEDIARQTEDIARLSTGDIVPTWVVDGMDASLKAVEEERDSLRVSSVQLQTELDSVTAAKVQFQQKLAEKEDALHHLHAESARLAEQVAQRKANEVRLDSTATKLRDDCGKLRVMLLGDAVDGMEMSAEEVRTRVAEQEARMVEQRKNADRQGAALDNVEAKELSALLESFNLIELESDEPVDADAQVTGPAASPYDASSNQLPESEHSSKEDSEIQMQIHMEKEEQRQTVQAAVLAAATGASPDEIVDAGCSDDRSAARSDVSVGSPPRLDRAKREELQQAVSRSILMQSEALGEQGATAEEAQVAVAQALDRLNEALEAQLSIAGAIAIAMNPPDDHSDSAKRRCVIVAAAAQRVASAHGDEATPTAMIAAAHAATVLTRSGATANVAMAAAERATSSVLTRNETIEQVNEEAQQMAVVVDQQIAIEPVVPPGWTLDGWLKSLDLGTVVCAAARKHFDALLHGKEGKLTAAEQLSHERAYVEHLGKNGSVESVISMLKESPLLYDLASAIFEGASDFGTPEDPVPPAEVTREKTADELNAEMVQAAGALTFANEPSVFFGGLDRLIGAPNVSVGLVEALELEHCTREDADTPFEARNYGTITTSRIEWFFVARAGEKASLAKHFDDVGYDDWPQGTRGPKRSTMSLVTFKQSAIGKKLDALLSVEGDQPMSEPEFLVVRAYTGPLFEKCAAWSRSHPSASGQRTSAADPKLLIPKVGGSTPAPTGTTPSSAQQTRHSFARWSSTWAA